MVESNSLLCLRLQVPQTLTLVFSGAQIMVIGDRQTSVPVPFALFTKDMTLGLVPEWSTTQLTNVYWYFLCPWRHLAVPGVNSSVPGSEETWGILEEET